MISLQRNCVLLFLFLISSLTFASSKSQYLECFLSDFAAGKEIENIVIKGLDERKYFGIKAKFQSEKIKVGFLIYDGQAMITAVTAKNKLLMTASSNLDSQDVFLNSRFLSFSAGCDVKPLKQKIE